MALFPDGNPSRSSVLVGEEAVRDAEYGISEVTKPKSIVVDEDGNEVEKPSKWKDCKSPPM